MLKIGEYNMSRKDRPCLLRQESFGGTLFNVDNGKRLYVDNSEFSLLERTGTLTDHLQTELRAALIDVIIRRPPELFDYSFSGPDKVFFELTRACNIRCLECLNSSGIALSKELTEADVLKAIDDLAEFGAQEIRFTGGEPMIATALPVYIRRTNEWGLRVSIGTNAMLATGTLAEMLAESGLDTAIVSIDGLEDNHNRIRGKGSFKKTFEGMRNLRSAGIEVRINMVILNKNVEDVVPFVEMAIQERLSVMLRRFIASGRGARLTQGGITWEKYEKLREDLEPYFKNPYVHIDGHYLKNEQTPSRIPLPFQRSACSAGQRGLVILPDGNIQTCGFLAALGEPAYGNVLHTPMSQLWKSTVTSRYLLTRRAMIDQSSPSKSWGNECLALIETGQSH